MKQSFPTKDLGTLVRRARLRAGLSNRRLASAARVDSTWLSRLERGDYRSPDPRHLHSLARALELDTTELFLAAGYQGGADLPALAPYLRAKYDDVLPPEAIQQVTDYFDFVANKYRSRRGGDDVEHHS